MDLACRLDQVLKVRAGEEVSQVDEFAVAFVFDVDGAPAVLAATDHLSVHVDVALGTDDCEGDDGLGVLLVGCALHQFDWKYSIP